MRTTSGASFPAIDDPAELTTGHLVDISGLYPVLAAKGYDYGEGFRVIKQIRQSGNTKIFELLVASGRTGEERPAEKQPAESPESLDPLLLDGLFQTVLAMEYYLSDTAFDEDDFLLVPYAMDQVNLVGEVRERCFVRIGEGDIRPNAEGIVADLRAYNEQGECVLAVDNMVFKKVPADFLRAPVEEPAYYQPVWEETEIAESDEDSAPSTSNALIFADQQGFGAKLALSNITLDIQNYPTLSRNGRTIHVDHPIYKIRDVYLITDYELVSENDSLLGRNDVVKKRRSG